MTDSDSPGSVGTPSTPGNPGNPDNLDSRLDEDAGRPGSPKPVRPLVVFGTRPEAIKLCPVLLECRQRGNQIQPIVCSTGQHREMLQQVLDYFGITPDVDLGLMRPSQTLTSLTALCLQAVDEVILAQKPDLILVQGDTTTVMAASMAAFYHRLPVVHVEAGLRTGDLTAPWPEEFNRRVAGIVSDLHCAPTQKSADALAQEGVPSESIRVTGNTVIDALFYTVNRERQDDQRWREKYPAATAESVVLITGHRRENFGGGLRSICAAIADLAEAHPQTEFIYPVHLNPNVQGPVHQLLDGHNNIHLVPPADYPEFVWLMDRASVVLTDSGGVQEEAPSLGSAVLVTREKTERPEAVESGLAELVGTDREKIVARVSAKLALAASATKEAGTVAASPQSPTAIQNPYGDGQASRRIVDWILERWGANPTS